ncbi:SDR family oxidoreductase [Streptomonospora sp. PA3]|uniref:SDR family NAD(P)-dependent oxidoreductase n=1 Tax=Streptomonospora sp. PA3 TaxID=2607326 RepID=UPI0012DCF3F8|nr:SDR family oxidoreductase [Streptomonospora sp. PA3]MUL41484.1 SDR family oxidoreductase [Streptomonospora sp. PA3]
MSAFVPHRFAHKTVLVTGAGADFGAEIAVRAAEEGADVVVHFRSSKDGAEATAERIRAVGRTAHLVQADLAEGKQIQRMAEEAWARFGRVDVAVNNAAEAAREQLSWRDVTEESVDQVLGVGVKGTLLATHEFGSRMLEQQSGGAIVNIGSTVVSRGSARVPQYAAAKYGVIGVTKSYAQAFAPRVRVNTFAPGFIETESTKRRTDWQNGHRERLIEVTPMGHVPSPGELAGAALFLASPEAGHITGAFLAADGGYNMPGA